MQIETDEHIYTVSQLNNEVKFLLEDSFPSIWIEGEVSNFAAPGSGHWYFCLKDSLAQVKCAMFKGQQKKLNFIPKNGDHILVRASASLYANRGDYQLIIDHMEERGSGKLQKAFEELKKKLQAAGLFAEEHKQELPLYPETIGVITSPTGAAIRDILHVLARRYAHAKVIIYPTLVQGSTAAPAIAKAIQTANQRKECDVLILARGGGSLEDLWPFNEEIVAQAIFKSKLAIISGIGHEVDFTIADFVADVRAPTPSAAAEMVTPDVEELQSSLRHYRNQLKRKMQHKLHLIKQQITWMQKHLDNQHPKRRLLEKMQNLDILAQQLKQIIKYQIEKKQQTLAHYASKLQALSPLATLSRGYAIASNAQHEIIRNTEQLKTGEKIEILFSQGKAECLVEKIISKGSQSAC